MWIFSQIEPPSQYTPMAAAITALFSCGIAGVVIKWFMQRHDAGMLRHDAKIDAWMLRDDVRMKAIEIAEDRSTRAILLLLVSLKQTPEVVKDQANGIIREIEDSQLKRENLGH